VVGKSKYQRGKKRAEIRVSFMPLVQKAIPTYEVGRRVRRDVSADHKIFFEPLILPRSSPKVTWYIR